MGMKSPAKKKEIVKKELGIRARKINNAWYWELDKVKQE